MKVLLFGAGGYLGRHLKAELVAAGQEVVVPTAADGSRLDLTRAESLAGIDWRVDAVYLFAGVTGTAAAFDQPAKYLLGNELILLNVLDAIRRSAARPRVVFPSSRLVYAGAEIPLTELARQTPKTLYAAHKIACEHYLAVYAGAYDLPYTVLRICVPYGNRLGEDYSFGTVGNYIRQARDVGVIRLYGGGAVRRSFTHVEDICRLTRLAATHPATYNQVCNLPGEDYSLAGAAAMIAARFGARVENQDWPELDARIESGSTVFDASKLTTLLTTHLNWRFVDWTAGLGGGPAPADHRESSEWRVRTDPYSRKPRQTRL